MAVSVIEKGEVSDGALPVGELVAQMRLADGVTNDPEQAARLRARLRAAIDAVERRTGMIILARTVTLAGQAEDARRIRLPVRPVIRTVVATVKRDGIEMALGPVGLEPGGDQAVAILSAPVRDAEYLSLVCEAGHASWMAVPASLRQAILLVAEALDAGEGVVLTPVAESLLAAFRDVRIGRRG